MVGRIPPGRWPLPLFSECADLLWTVIFMLLVGFPDSRGRVAKKIRHPSPVSFGLKNRFGTAAPQDIPAARNGPREINLLVSLILHLL